MSSHDKLRVREWARLSYHDPEQTLRELRRLQYAIARSDLPAGIRNLRKREFKKYSELRQAALFCYGMSLRLGVTVGFAMQEAADYDAVCRWSGGKGIENYAPLQLKELPASGGSPVPALNALLAKLDKYTDSQDLQVAIYTNTPGRIELSDLILPTVRLGGLYLVGAISTDQERWALVGDLMQSPTGTEFEHPEPK